MKTNLLFAAFLVAASMGFVGAVHAQGISQKVAVCNPGFTSRCVAPDASGNTPVTGTVTVVPSGTQNVNVSQVGGNAVTTTLPVSDAGGSLTVDTLQLPSTLGAKTATASLSIAPATDSTFPVTQSGTWNLNNISGTVSLPTGAATAANQTTANASLSSIDTKLTAPLVVAQSTASSLNAQVVGSVAGATADSGNPVKVGAIYNATPPTYTTGQRTDLQATSRGETLVALANGSAQVSVSAPTDAQSVGTSLWVANISRLFNGSNYDRGRSIQGVDGTGLGVLASAISPVSAASAAITPVVTSAVASNLVVKASAGNLYGFQVTSGASAGYVLLFNATSLPADGAVTPIKCYAIAANSTIGVDFRPGPPVRFGTGITIGFSTTGCFTLTASTTAFISGDAQ